MIHVYGANIDRNELKRTYVEPPKGAGSHYKAIQHGELIDAMDAAADDRGWKLTGGKFSLSKDRRGLAAAFDLTGGDLDAPEGQTLGMGVLTANDRRTPLKIVVGTTVACCNNGMVSGELILKMKHTIGKDLPGVLSDAFDRYATAAKMIESQVAAMRETGLSDRVANEVLMNAGRNGVMPWSMVGKVDAEYRKPTFAEHGRGTSWAMLNAFTHIVKACNPATQLSRISAFRGYLPVADREADDVATDAVVAMATAV